MPERGSHRPRRGRKDGDRAVEKAARRRELIHKKIARALGVRESNATAEGITDPSVQRVSLGLSRALDPVSIPGAIGVSTFPAESGLSRMPDASKFFVVLGNFVVESGNAVLETPARAGEMRTRIRIANMTPMEARRLVAQGHNYIYGATIVSITELPGQQSSEYKGHVSGDFFRKVVPRRV